MDVLPVAEAWMKDSYLVRAYEGLVVFWYSKMWFGSSMFKEQ
jgi:hypothetical protein